MATTTTTSSSSTSTSIPEATLHHVPKTISSPIYQILLELGNDNDIVPNKVEVIVKTFPDLKMDDHLSVNPMGTSPAYQDHITQTNIWESGAVLSWILEKYDTHGKFHPRCSGGGGSSGDATKQRLKFLNICQFITATLYPYVSSFYLHTWKPKEEQDDEFLNKSFNVWRTQLAPIVVGWIDENDDKDGGESPYLLGGTALSAVDYLLCKPLNNINSLGMLQEFPKLQRIFEEVSSKHSWNVAYNNVPLVEQEAGDDDKQPIIVAVTESEKNKRQKKDDDGNSATSYHDKEERRTFVLVSSSTK